MEQLGPCQVFYTMSCPNKRWPAILASILQRKTPELMVLDPIEEMRAQEAFENKTKAKEKMERYQDEDEIEDDEDEVVLGVHSQFGKGKHFVHETVSSAELEDVGDDRRCHLHQNCRRTRVEEYLDKTAANKLLEQNVLDTTRIFDSNMKSFRKNILTCKNGPMKVRYYQDRTEFQARGHPHVHGMAWSDMDQLERDYKGLKVTFQKLKEREKLTAEDIRPLRQFIDASATCTTDTKEIKQMLQKTDRKKHQCGQNCNRNPENCNRCAEEVANIIRESVLEVNVHHHTKTCRKKGPKCRFGIPRCPSKYTMISQAMTEEVKKTQTETVDGINYVKNRVELHMNSLESKLRENQKENLKAEIEETLDEMLEKCFQDISITEETDVIIIKEAEKEHKFKTILVQEAWEQNPEYSEEPINLLTPREILRSAVYQFFLSISTYGTKVIMKRSPKDIFVNNYNPFWMLAWNGNMDIQICLDYFSIITYVTDYLCKPEAATFEKLKEVKKAKEKGKTNSKDVMYALAQSYLNSRELGESETYYKLDPSLHYKQSNVKTIFVSSGFPHNRAKFLRRCKVEEEGRGMSVDGHEGKFLESEEIHTKYSLRPESMEEMCLAQMAMRFTLVTSAEANKIRSSGKEPTAPAEALGYEGLLTIATGQDEDTTSLTDFIELENNKIMRLRKFDAVLRRHKFNPEKDEHEYCYSELLLFSSWRCEDELFPQDATKCLQFFTKLQKSIEVVKKKLFPHLADVELGRAMVENFEADENEIGAELDAEGEMAEGGSEGATIAEDFACLQPDDAQETAGDGDAEAAPFFRAPVLLEMDELVERTRRLVWEQRVALNIVIKYCRKLAMMRRTGNWKLVKAPLLTIIGGAGTGKSMLINTISLWIQKLLATPGDDISSPYLILAAPTGETTFLLVLCEHYF